MKHCCLLVGNAFGKAALYNTSSYARLKAELTRLFSGDDYKLFGVNDDATVEKVAINDVMGKLDISIQEQLKVLQLAGRCQLEVLLEFAKLKLCDSTLTNTFASSMSPHESSSGFSNRLDRLEKIVEGMTSAKVSRGVCDECHKSGHDKGTCFKLKTCFLCDKKGHVARFCPDKAS